MGIGAIDTRPPEVPRLDVPYTLGAAKESTEFCSKSRIGDVYSPGIRDQNEARQLISKGLRTLLFTVGLWTIGLDPLRPI